MEFSWEILLVLAFVAFIAGFISSIAGAGGMIVLPVLLWVGIPPLNALAVNKFQSVFGTLSSTINFLQKGQLQLAPLRVGLIAATAGAIVGTFLIQSLSQQLLATLLPWLLISLALYFLFSSDISDLSRSPRISQSKFNIWVGSGLGLYGGFFGPGMGSFYAAAFTALRGASMREATASTKPFVLAANTTSMTIFIGAGHQLWTVAILMACLQFVGARIGSGLVVKKGAVLVKPLLVTTTLLIAATLLVRS